MRLWITCGQVSPTEPRNPVAFSRRSAAFAAPLGVLTLSHGPEVSASAAGICALAGCKVRKKESPYWQDRPKVSDSGTEGSRKNLPPALAIRARTVYADFRTAYVRYRAYRYLSSWVRQRTDR